MIGLDFGASLSAAASASTGFPSQADLERKVLSPLSSVVTGYEGNSSAYVDRVAGAYRTAFSVVSTAKSVPGSSSVLNFGKIEAQIKALGSQAYQKAMDMGAPPEALAKISFLATPEQLAASQKPSAQPSLLLRPGAVALFKSPVSRVTLIDPIPVRTETQAQPPPPPAMTPMNLPLQPPVQPAPAPTPPPEPSWISKNWYWVVGGAAVLAGGGYVLYTQSKRSL